MIHIAAPLYQQINGAHQHKTYTNPAPQDATYPYVTYKLSPVGNTEKDRDDFMLEVSCWDKSESTSHVRAMQLADSVHQALTNFRYLDEKALIIVSRPSMGGRPDPDPLIKRYDVTAIIKTYRR